MGVWESGSKEKEVKEKASKRKGEQKKKGEV
jgi:hypothetical protein